jgi:hypothetical protein
MNGSLLRGILRRIFVHNFYLKFIAAVLTLALYIWVSEDRETVVAGYTGVRIVVPDDLVLVSEPLDRVKVTVRGRWSDIARFDPDQLDPLRVDLTRSDKNSVIQITTNMIRVPPGLRVVAIEPNSMYVQLEPEARKTVPIVVTLEGEPRPSYTVEQVQVTPKEVVALGPESRIEALSSAPTRPVGLSRRTESFRQRVDLRRDDGLITFEITEPIVVDVRIRAEESQVVLEDIPVVAVNTTYETDISPSSTAVTVRGPRSVVEAMSRDVLRAELDMSAEEERPPGVFSKQVEIRNLPADVELVQAYPRSFRVRTLPRSTP